MNNIENPSQKLMLVSVYVFSFWIYSLGLSGQGGIRYQNTLYIHTLKLSLSLSLSPSLSLSLTHTHTYKQPDAHTYN